ncbi:hypothetical protein QL285_086301 [Trifolium repens]|nr:hypothetical protein QL285_086301 [Trifolium repens]
MSGSSRWGERFCDVITCCCFYALLWWFWCARGGFFPSWRWLLELVWCATVEVFMMASGSGFGEQQWWFLFLGGDGVVGCSGNGFNGGLLFWQRY